VARRVRWALAIAVAIPALGAAMTSSTAAAVPAITTSTRTIATLAGEPYQRDAAYHRTAVGRLRNGQTALVVIGGAGTTASQFAQALLGLGFVEALGMDIDSSANVNWHGASLNRPDYQRQIPTGIIAFRQAR